MSKQKLSSILDFYRTTLEVAGKHRGRFKRSLLFFILSFSSQGLAFVCFYPLMNSIFISDFNLNDSLIWFSVMILLSFLSFMFRWLADDFSYALEGGTTDVAHDTRLTLGKKLRTMPLESLYRYKTGEISSIFSANVDNSAVHMNTAAGMLLEVFIVPFVIIAATFFIDYRIALAMLSALPLAVIVYKSSMVLNKKNKEETSKENALLESSAIEYLQGLPILRTIDQTGVNAKNLQNSILKVKNIQKKGLMLEALPTITITALVEFAFLLTLSLGIFWVVTSSLTIAALIAVLVMLGRLIEPVSNFLAFMSTLQTIEVGFKKIKSILDIKNLPILKPIKKAKTFDIEFKNVNFSYKGHSQKALNNLSFIIKTNSLTAIIGVSGGGKTTITRLMMRYADPSSGYIKIGGVDIKNITQKELMSYISIVFQDVYLFDDTILNNIRIGRANASNEEVIEAALKANCYEFISKLPKGYETKVGEIGGNLSGGEKQRISIARAILKNSSIVILDEPTSALDIVSEVAVQKALNALIKDKTVIIISHKLSTISHADTILVIEDGALKESGAHVELLKIRGRYKEMHDARQRVAQKVY